jgi:hypothetical protein
MIECSKRQKIVTRSTGNVNYKCLNNNADEHLQIVTEEICAGCPVRVFKNSAPKKIPEKLPTSNEDCPDCDKKPDWPGLGNLAMAWRAAVNKWKKAGKPIRSKEEVHNIVTDYCKKCDWYENNRCRGCGCQVNEWSVAVLNKARMATEHCPKGYW